VTITKERVTMRADEAQYRLLFEASPLPTWIIDEASGRFLVVNDAALAQYGYSREEFRAMSVEAIRLPQESGRMRDEFRAQANTPFVLAGSWHHRRKDGSVFAVELRAARISFNGAPALLSFMLDADREEAVAALLLRERQLAETEAVAHVGSWDWDARTDEVTWSRELYRIYGVTWGVMASQHEFLSRVHPDDRVRVSIGLAAATERGEKRFEYECRVVRAGQDVRTLHTRQVVRYDAAGRPQHVTGMVQDVTEQRRAMAARAPASTPS
jgi:PAS domain S-box-containing protein